ncbi:3D domain-containing protein [Alkalithermobacter paradoxus]|uniref:Cell wall-binding protein YocH n=1 Tax=Alkalithermobacter paradoxus TaxID=29349 RepID=A0A1V4I673_9FIRM|nr:cell wall-binding protein YocH precursor [[Clostridium] thermoalcaliphilum]
MSLKTKKIYILIISVCLILGTTGIYQALNKKLSIKLEDETIAVSTFASTVREVLEENDIQISSNDKVLPDMDTKLKDGMEILIKKAFNVALLVDGKERTIISTGESVRDLLKEENIELSELDKVFPSLDHKLKPNDEIKIVRVTETIVTESKSIPFVVNTIYDDNLEIGKVVNVQKGSEGKKELSYKIIEEDGKEVQRILVSENVVKEPQNEVIKKGSKNFIITSRGERRTFTKSMVVSASAYTAGYESTGKTPCHPQYGITSMGTRVRHGVIAVDPKVIPLGSSVYIESMGIYRAEDTGGAIKGNKIDIYMDDLSRARKFGRRNLKIYVLK